MFGQIRRLKPWADSDVPTRCIQPRGLCRVVKSSDGYHPTCQQSASYLTSFSNQRFGFCNHYIQPISSFGCSTSKHEIKAAASNRSAYQWRSRPCLRPIYSRRTELAERCDGSANLIYVLQGKRAVHRFSICRVRMDPGERERNFGSYLP